MYIFKDRSLKVTVTDKDNKQQDLFFTIGDIVKILDEDYIISARVAKIPKTICENTITVHTKDSKSIEFSVLDFIMRYLDAKNEDPIQPSLSRYSYDVEESWKVFGESSAIFDINDYFRVWVPKMHIYGVIVQLIGIEVYLGECRIKLNPINDYYSDSILLKEKLSLTYLPEANEDLVKIEGVYLRRVTDL